MSCDEVRQVLLDGAGAGRSRGDVTAHLRQCGSCRAAGEVYARIRNVLQPTAHDGAVRDGAAEPVAGWDAFEQRLLASPRPNGARGGGRWIGVRGSLGLGLAASLLLGVVGFQVGRWYAGSPAPLASGGKNTDVHEPTQNPPPHARLAAADVTRQVRAFEEVSQVFDGRASWVMLSDDATDMGLAPQPLDRPQPALLMLRMTMLRENQIISQADLVIVTGESADLSVPIARGRTLRYQIDTTRDTPTRLNLWAEVLTPAGGEALGALATTLRAEPGRNVSAGSLTTTGGVYELQIDFAQGAATEVVPGEIVPGEVGPGGASRPAPPAAEMMGS